MPFFHPAAAGEFSPLWRMLDDYATPRTSSCAQTKSPCKPKTAPQSSQQVNTFYQPRFDVKEYGDRFELDGEFAGVAQSDIDIEFTDPQTLKISGRASRHDSQSQTKLSEHAATSSSSENNASPARPSSPTEFHKASVEDETTSSAPDATADAETEAETDWTPVPTPTSTSTPAAPDARDTSHQSGSTAAQPTNPHAPVTKTEKPRYWLSERNVGRFQRTFTFPGDRVDTDNVKASLRDGILSVVVPKAPEPAKVKISIQ